MLGVGTVKRSGFISALWDFLEENFSELVSRAPRESITVQTIYDSCEHFLTPAVIYNACENCFDFLVCKWTDFNFKKFNWIFKMATKANNVCHPQMLILYIKLFIVIY